MLATAARLIVPLAVWIIFAAAVTWYQDRDGQTAGEHEENGPDMGEPEFSAAA